MTLRSSTRLLGWALCVGALAVLGGFSSAAALDAPDPDPSSGTMHVRIEPDATASPTPTSSSTPSSTPLSRPPAAVTGTPTITTGTVSQATIPSPTDADAAVGDDPVVINGILAMSGLTVTAAPTLTPDNGHVTLDFVVRNLSPDAFDSTAVFWIDDIFGSRIAVIDDVAVAALEPDETRRVQVRVVGLGQHIVLHAHTTLTPPSTINAVDVAPLTRDTTIPVVPWFSVIMLGIFTALGIGVWWELSPRGLGLSVRRWEGVPA